MSEVPFSKVLRMAWLCISDYAALRACDGRVA